MQEKIKIKKEHKEQLEARFSIENATEYSTDRDMMLINIKCPLCVAHSVCSKCPFSIESTKEEVGCIVWLNRVLSSHLHFNFSLWRISFKERDREVVEKQFRTIKKYAEDNIAWID